MLGAGCIGAALACELGRAGWRLGLVARRLDRLEALRLRLGSDTVVRPLDIAQDDAAEVLQDLGGADLVVVSSGTGGHAALDRELDRETVGVNVAGFMAVAQVAMRHFLAREGGHLVGISSIAAFAGILPRPTPRRRPSSRHIWTAFGRLRGIADTRLP